MSTKMNEYQRDIFIFVQMLFTNSCKFSIYINIQYNSVTYKQFGFGNKDPSFFLNI